MQRPDLSSIDPEVRRYIEVLEKRLGIGPEADQDDADHTPDIFPQEPATTISIITVSENCSAKRSYRHLYSRQHRGGMGVFDLEVNPPDFPTAIGIADEKQTVLVFTNRARVYRVGVHQFESVPIRAKGGLPFERLGFEPGETIQSILPEQARGYVAILGRSGKVRLLRHHLFGEHMKQGTVVFNVAEFGPLACACWTPGEAELFIITAAGMGIRFAEKTISPQGDIGIRLGVGDTAVGVASVTSDSNVFMIGADGRGTVRQMIGFAANKSTGGSGKIAFKNNLVVGAVAIDPADDLFVISRLGKMIRFRADEVPVTDGPVQGVNCINLRADEVTGFARTTLE